jgi:hypothetical protein
MYVEPTWKNGKNSVLDFDKPTIQTEDNWVDAIAITPVCLRVSYSLDNL